MNSFKIDEIKNFMNVLFKSSVFDKYEVQSAVVKTFTTFEIKGTLNRAFFDEEPQRDFCTWEEIRPFVFLTIKGSKLPKYIKIVLSAPKDVINKLNSKASALFVNITYENNIVIAITGYAIKELSLNHEAAWDEYFINIMKENKISVSTQV